MEWYYYALIIGIVGIGIVIVYILLRKKGFSIPYFSDLTDPLLFGTRKGHFDELDKELKPAYDRFDGQSRKKKIQDRTTKQVKKIYSREQYIENKYGIQEDWDKNPDQYDIVGVDTPEPRAPERMLLFFTGTKMGQLRFNRTKQKMMVKSSVETEKFRVKGAGFTPNLGTALQFQHGVLLKVKVDNRKRSHEQKLRPMPYGQGRFYPEYAPKAVGEEINYPASIGAFESEYEFVSRDPTELSKRDVKAIYVNRLAVDGVKNKLPKSWHHKIIVVDDSMKDSVSKDLTTEEREMISYEKHIKDDPTLDKKGKPKWAKHVKFN